MKTRHPAWSFLQRALTLAFIAFVIWMLWDHVRAIAWREVGRSLAALPGSVLGLAALLGIASHALFSCFDLLGRRYTRHGLATRSVMLVNFISYAFNLNLGSLVGSVALRFRLYARLGLRNATIARVMGFSMLTNWLGYILLAGLLLLFNPPEFPAGWKLGNGALPWLGAGLLAVGLAYLAACWRWPMREWQLRGHVLRLPASGLALTQTALSMLNWSLMGTMVWVLLQGRLPWDDVLVVLLVGAIAGVITHVPAGLGVLEAVFVTLLGDRLPEGDLIAALLAYRGLYYLLPLALAALAFALLEARKRPVRERQPHAPRAARPAAHGLPAHGRHIHANAGSAAGALRARR